MFGRFRKTVDPDVVVLGSGAAGLTAAIVAHDHGAKVQIVERTTHVGGTTAVSGGGIWIPVNHHMGSLGIEDSRDEAITYCRALTMGRVDDRMIEAFVDTSAKMIGYLEQRTPLRFTPVSAADYYTGLPGAKLAGRSLEPAPFDVNLLGDWKDRLRPANVFAFPVTLQEVFKTYQAFLRPWNIPQDVVVQRMGDGIVTLGQALAGGLLKAVLDRGIPISLETRGKRLIMASGQVVGVEADQAGKAITIGAKKGVILATAGFEWNSALSQQFLGFTVEHPNTPPYNEGDGLVMAMEVGADLSNMGEVWNYPSMIVPGETYENVPLVRAIKPERAAPHVIWVNARGQRFVNEAANYNAVGKTLFALETDNPQYRNNPAWAIFDRQYRDRYVVGTSMPGDPDPEWLPRADTLEALAGAVGIDARNLLETVERWNRMVGDGVDRDFGRGGSAFDRLQGDAEAPHPSLGTIAQPPFYALPVQPGTLGTKGGPRTNAHAQVLSMRGVPINGLYAVGNVAASVTGPSYFGVGSTLGPAMTFGYIAGKHIADGIG